MSSPFKILDSNYQERVRNSFAQQGAMALIGAQIDTLEPGRVVISLVPRSDLSQQHGFVHGGIVASAMDSACGYAASSLMAADVGVLTLEFKINFVAPADGDRIECIGLVRKAGRTITLVEGEAFAIKQSGSSDNQRRLIATMSASMMTIHQRASIQS